ncbi:MAG: aldehyde:ferredoxin oxidoreductase [Anaerolineales bacterium]|nr:MAG: aldehyde:ferredoxin oxidoreductase [Anaerolineales bacterium]
MYGYHGRILHVDLNNMALKVEEPDEVFYRRYMGGSALGLYYLLRQTPAGADPMGPENTLVFALSMLTGTPISGQSRITVVAKSPLTEAVGDSQAGGFFPAAMKFSGFDAIVVRGRAREPLYLHLHDGEVKLRAASHLWGKTTGEVENMIRRELDDPKIEVLQTGPAGENGVRFAALINMCSRANGRTGMGAVMGSKNLKAIVVHGSQRPKIADRKALLQLARWGMKNLEDSDTYTLSVLGTPNFIRSQNESGGLPSYNWRSGTFEGWKALDGGTLANTILLKRETCYACVVRCKCVVKVDREPYQVDPRYGGPEYEALATFGACCGVDNLAAVSYANQLCNQYGMDTISCAMTIAWAMDCYEHGLINADDTGGVELKFGNAEAMVELVKSIAKREGFGDLLADGSARAAKKLGREAEDLVLTVKKQELPAHMPQLKRSFALIYAVNPFGPDHQSSQHDPTYTKHPERMAQLGLTDPQPNEVLNKEKVRFALTTQFFNSCIDSLAVCQFVYGPAWQLYSPAQLVEAVQAVSGWDVSLEELLRLGERRLNMLRCFNAREGIGREADRLPKKLMKPLTGGKSDGMFITEEEVERAKDWYYSMAGWDVATGLPTRKKLEELELHWLEDELSN